MFHDEPRSSPPDDRNDDSLELESQRKGILQHRKHGRKWIDGGIEMSQVFHDS